MWTLKLPAAGYCFCDRSKVAVLALVQELSAYKTLYARNIATAQHKGHRLAGAHLL